MLKKHIIGKQHILPCSSFILSVVFLVSALSLVDGAFAMGVFGVVAVLCGIVFNWLKGSAQFCISKWEEINPITHWGLIGFAIVGLFIIIFYCISNFSIKIIPKNNEA